MLPQNVDDHVACRCAERERRDVLVSGSAVSVKSKGMVPLWKARNPRIKSEQHSRPSESKAFSRGVSINSVNNMPSPPSIFWRTNWCCEWWGKKTCPPSDPRQNFCWQRTEDSHHNKYIWRLLCFKCVERYVEEERMEKRKKKRKRKEKEREKKVWDHFSNSSPTRPFLPSLPSLSTPISLLFLPTFHGTAQLPRQTLNLHNRRGSERRGRACPGAKQSPCGGVAFNSDPSQGSSSN